ncbi:MAG: hypothetical protein ABI035_10615 [Gemmatimonadaceae bacterium]
MATVRLAISCPARSRLQQLVAQVGDANVLALLVNTALLCVEQVVANLRVERLVRDLDLLSPVLSAGSTPISRASEA